MCITPLGGELSMMRKDASLLLSSGLDKGESPQYGASGVCLMVVVPGHSVVSFVHLIAIVTKMILRFPTFI